MSSKIWSMPAPALIFVMLLILLSGCAHPIAFQDLHYSVPVNKHDVAVVVVIDKSTLDNVVSIRSFTTGIAQRWDAHPGEMLKQIADIEFPQMFNKYQQENSFIVPPWKDETFYLVLTIPDYQFKNFHAYFTVKLEVYNEEKSLLLEKTYKEEGVSQGSKMFWAGAFGMKSAVRQSSLDALKKIFNQIRPDLIKQLEYSTSK